MSASIRCSASWRFSSRYAARSSSDSRARRLGLTWVVLIGCLRLGHGLGELLLARGHLFVLRCNPKCIRARYPKLLPGQFLSWVLPAICREDVRLFAATRLPDDHRTGPQPRLS